MLRISGKNSRKPLIRTIISTKRYPTVAKFEKSILVIPTKASHGVLITGKIHVKRYLAENPVGVAVISHGFTEGAPKYEELICCQKWKIKTIITLTARIPSRTSMCLQSILLFSAVTIILLTVLFCAELCRKTFSACFIISNAVFNSQVLCCGNNMRSEKWIKAAAAKTEAMHLPVRGG